MRIYIIDDDQLSLFLTKTTLVLEGTTQDITTYLSASEALKALNTSNEDELPEIFLDLNMPEMDGWEFLDALTPIVSKLTNRCKIYILTSSLETSDAERSNEYPLVAGFIHKPLNNVNIKLVVSGYRELNTSIQ